MKKILGNLWEIAIQKRTVRAGKGKMRDRKYKKTSGMLLVIGDKENIKINGIDISKVSELNIFDLAKGGLGRLTVYTEEAIKQFEKEEETKGEEK